MTGIRQLSPEYDSHDRNHACMMGRHASILSVHIPVAWPDLTCVSRISRLAGNRDEASGFRVEFRGKKLTDVHIPHQLISILLDYTLFPLLLDCRAGSRQKSRVDRLKAKVEPLPT